MRRLSLHCLPGRQLSTVRRPYSSLLYRRSALIQSCSRRFLANVRDSKEVAELWFGGSTPRPQFRESEAGKDHKAPDERTLKLGKTIRTLQDRLPSLLATPLPQEILSPQISLRLFPSTHPHLPSVTGRIAYTAALWTSPVAWGRMPVLGNIKLIILSERMLRTGSSGTAVENNEKLVVRWKTCAKSKGEVTDQIKKVLGRNEMEPKDEDFHGLFIFEFDDEGRISSHTIEHVEEGNNWEKTATVISVTDWLLGKAWGKQEHGGIPGLAFCELRDRGLVEAGEKK